MGHGPHTDLQDLLPRLYAFARTIVGNPETARDLVQETAKRALAARNVPHERPAYRAWLFRIVRNAAIDEVRHLQMVVESSEAASAAMGGADLWRYDDSHIAKLTIEQGLARISPEHREIIALIDIAGFSYAEAADLQEVPAGTVMSRIARARNALLAAIEAGPVRVLKTTRQTKRHGR